MAVRSRPFAAGSSIAGGVLTIVYQVPAGRTALVKAYGLTNRSGGALNVQLEVRIGGAMVQVARATALAADATVMAPFVELALGPGDALGIRMPGSSGTLACHWFAAGSLLLGEPQ